MSINKEILKTIKYFAIFAYYPTSEEIYTFLQAKISKNSFNIKLERMIKLKVIKKYEAGDENVDRYTVGEYGIKRVKNSELRIKNSKKKLNSWRFRLYTRLISLFSQIKLIGLSGSISMMNADENDDIDLFIITAKNRLFTGRLIALVLAQLLGLRRSRDSATQIFQKTNKTEKLTSHYKDKVCLNLFFDESNLKVPKFKQTEFVGHEVLQMKPVINKDSIHKRFLTENNWVFKLFPNAKSQILNHKSQISSKRFKFKISNKIESFLKKLQLNLINRHKTTEIITDSQLWFHPDDFERKIKKTL